MTTDDSPDFNFDEESGDEMTTPQIYSMVLLEEDVLMVIAFSAVDDLRASLTNHKAKETARLKKEEVPYEEFQLQYDILPLEGEKAVNEKGDCRLRITMKRRKSFKVSIQKPSEF